MITLDCTSFDLEGKWRIERLANVLSDFLSHVDEASDVPISRLYDHKGHLTVTWVARPGMKTLIEECWESTGEDKKEVTHEFEERAI